MQSSAVVALALLESVSAFQAPVAAMRTVSRASAPAMFSEGDLGVLREHWQGARGDPRALFEYCSRNGDGKLESRCAHGAPPHLLPQPSRARSSPHPFAPQVRCKQAHGDGSKARLAR